MSTNYNARIVSSGLVLNLDASNARSLSNVSANFLTYPEDLTTAPWYTIGSNVYRNANVTTAPDGTLTADELGTRSWVSGDSVYQDFTIGAGNGTKTYTISVFLKAGVNAPSISFAAFYTGSSTDGFSTGVYPPTGFISAGTGVAIAYANGWYRVYLTFTGTIAANSNIRFQVYLSSTGSVYLWGAQLELGSTLTPYYPVSRPTTTTWNDLSGNGYTATLGYPTLSSVEVLVVAGGGGGGPDVGGGGGGGGVVYNPSFLVISGTSYTVTVGTGGTAGSGPTPSVILGGNGANSIFGTITAIGGGAGGSYASVIGAPGGSGGGSGGDSSGTFLFAGNGIINQGFAGGIGTNNSVPYGAGGGGGAGGPGSNFTVAGGGAGGPGIGNAISGTLIYYGGGGGGGGGTDTQSDGRGYGGIGGGGTGSARTGPTSLIPGARDGTPNTGGGGGGTGGWNTAGAGGSGIVIVRYPGKIQKATGGVVTVVNNYTIHTFTSGTSAFVPYNFTSPRYSTTAGGCITLNGSDQVVDLNISAYDLGIRRSATFSGWMMSNSGAAYLLSDWDNLGMTMRFNDLNSADFYVYAGNRRITAAYTFTVNTWYNFVGVMDGANMYMYINGVQVGTQILGEDIGASPRTLKIGGRGDYSPPSSLQRVGSLQIYNRALSASEILSNFIALRGRYGV
jgi:hypothetical protein